MTSNMSALLFEQELSVPNDTVTPAFSRSEMGQMPEPNFRLEIGL